ncbi:uncharacterized protein LOC142625261 [Castanea sativa]|uniref:uncharacterized protein LOC142625261 n=1 Tax=Castanea sativa TaxID=21020 RepID=UPI003F64C4FE
MKVHTFHDGDLAAEMDLVCGIPYFERLYICLKGYKKGFLDGCKPFIDLDACHLKNKSRGQYCMVEAEVKDSWTWFINLLFADIGQNKRWVFMSDQQKGLVQTFIDNWLQYEHKICCRHLYNNFKKNHLGVLIKELFWRATKATYKEELDRVMDELKGINLECIRLYLMTRFQENKEKNLRVESDIYAKVLKRLHKEKLAANRWLACWAGVTQFEVKNGLQSFTVNLATTHYSCRKWDISGMLCAHVITCIFFNRQDAEQYVHLCYHVSTFKACYEPIISPINVQDMWRPSGVTPVQPPIKRRPPGRLKKKRARELNELTSRRAGISKQCKACESDGNDDKVNYGTMSFVL